MAEVKFTQDEKQTIVIISWLEGLSQRQAEWTIGDMISHGYSDATCRAILRSEPGINHYLRPRNEDDPYCATATNRRFDWDEAEEAIDPTEDNIAVVWEDDFSHFFGDEY